MNKFEDLVGKTLTEINGKVGCEQITFKTKDGWLGRLFHYQDCCEWVRVEDITGDLEDLVGSPIIMAEEVTSTDFGKVCEHTMWTFYKMATSKGYVTIRWRGDSNGYYGVSVNFTAER